MDRYIYKQIQSFFLQKNETFSKYRKDYCVLPGVGLQHSVVDSPVQDCSLCIGRVPATRAKVHTAHQNQALTSTL